MRLRPFFWDTRPHHMLTNNLPLCLYDLAKMLECQNSPPVWSLEDVSINQAPYPETRLSETRLLNFGASGSGVNRDQFKGACTRCCFGSIWFNAPTSFSFLSDRTLRLAQKQQLT